MIGADRSRRLRPSRLLWLVPLALVVLMVVEVASVGDGSGVAARILRNTVGLLALWLLLLSNRRLVVGIALALALCLVGWHAYVLLTAVDLERVDRFMGVLGVIWGSGLVALALWRLRHSRVASPRR